MKKSFFFFLLIFPIIGHAVTPTVRVDLSDCLVAGESQFAGLLLEQDSQFYVVTSSWAQMSASTAGKRCEKVWTSQGEIAVEPVVTDHVNGLALYKVLSTLVLENSFKKKNSADIFVLGTQGLETFSGQFVTTASRRHQIPGLDRAFEWMGAEVGSSVIGAAVWQGAQWMGLVSHQYLQLMPGSKTIVSRWNPQSKEKHDHLVVIPSSFVALWVKQQILHPQEPVIWPLEAQRRWQDQMVVGELTLTVQCPDPTNPNDNGEYPIGGNDGYGIGGDSVLNKACKVLVQKQGLLSSWSPSSLQEISSGNPELNSGVPVTLWYGLHRSNADLSRDYIFSAESLLKTALKTDQKWLVEREIRFIPAQQKALWKSAMDLRGAALYCYTNLFIHEENVQELVRKLFFFSVLAPSYSAVELKESDIDALLDRDGFYSFGWRTLTDGLHACDTPQLRSLAETFAQEYKKVWP